MQKDMILIGDENSPDYAIGDGGIKSISSVKAMDIVGAELSIDTLTARVAGDVNDGKLLAPADYDEIVTSDGYVLALPEGFSKMPEVPYGTALRYFRDDALFGLYYTKNVERLGANLYKVNAMSAIGLIDNQQHNGGLYTGQTFAAVAAEIIGGAIPYEVDDGVGAVAVYGWLPVASKRENLHQLMFAVGAALTKDADGTVRFTFLGTEDAAEIPETRLYIGGNVDYSSPASAVEVTEHAYYILSSDETVTLFDNTDGSGAAENTFVRFNDAPVHSLTAEGSLTIVESGVNYAVLTGTGILTGKLYTHVSKVISLQNENFAGEENVVTVTDATLVSLVNSKNVAKRVLSYYGSKKTVKAALVMENEAPGGLIRFTNPYGEAETGYLSNMEISVSSVLKANCEIVTDYIPTGNGNAYSKSEIFTGSGTFTVGENGARATLIGGGNGGYSGGNGADAEAGAWNGTQYPDFGEGADGGAGGPGGAGGKIFTVDLAPGTYAYSCGYGGNGGAASSTEPTRGGDGGATWIALDGAQIAASSDGQTSDFGVVNLLTGDVYALPGGNGLPGGKGGKRDEYAAEDVSLNGRTYKGGSDGTDYSYRDEDDVSVIFRGGGGGGAAAGMNGYMGGIGTERNYSGGDGADARVSPSLGGSRGRGGHGGYGGGGGGGGGIYGDNGSLGSGGSPVWTYTRGGGGKGGAGSPGGIGGSGCIILYS